MPEASSTAPICAFPSQVSQMNKMKRGFYVQA
jgi:hypothetical protein